MSTVAFIEGMIAAGFSTEEAIKAARVFEQVQMGTAEQAPARAPRTKAAERTRRWREKRHEASQTVTGDACDVTPVTVTPSLPLPPSPQTPQPPTPSREIKPPIVPQADQPAGPSRRKPKRAIPDGFPTAELIAEQQAKAREAGANFDVQRFAARFRDQCIAKDHRYAEWPAAWRNWCRTEIDRAPKTALAASQSRSAPSEADRWRRWLREYRLNGHWPSDDAGPRPGHPACRVPSALLVEFGHAPASAANDHKPDLFAQGDAA